MKVDYEKDDAVLVFRSTGECSIYYNDEDVGDDETVPRHILLAVSIFHRLDDHATVNALINSFVSECREAEEPS